jgi:uncharacterized protein (DUF1330 family)
MEFIETDEAAVSAFVKNYPADTPVVMLNLLKFRDRADYAAGLEVEPCSGREAFVRYGKAVAPMIRACGGELLWQGRQAAMLIGPQDKQWQLAILVKYPSARAFLDMIGSPAYKEIAMHRNAALVDSRLIAHREI